jgi:TetR/AcrR family transcriptional repressor of mexJK operon
MAETLGSLLNPDPAAPSAPRGIPAKRLSIMRAALAIFLKEGYGGAGIDAIAAGAGVSKQTVYNHFGDKQKLFLAVVEAARTEVDAGTTIDDSLLHSPEDLESDLTELGKQLLNVILDEKISALRRLLIAEAAQLDGGCGSGNGAGSGSGAAPRLVDWLTLRLAHLTMQGVLSVKDPQVAASHFVSLLAFPGQQLTNYGISPLTVEQRDRLAAAAADMFLRAYRVTPGSPESPVLIN